jgi:hypothetical protein
MMIHSSESPRNTKPMKHASAHEKLLFNVLKKDIEHDVEYIYYIPSLKTKQYICHMYMRNGFVIEGVIDLVVGMSSTQAIDLARRDALKKLSLIAEYNLADKFHILNDFHV